MTTLGWVFSKLLNLSVVDWKILLGLPRSFSAAVNALVDAVDLPSIAKSYLVFSFLVILTSSLV